MGKLGLHVESEHLKVLSCSFGDVPVPELLDVVPAPLSESTTVSHEEPKGIVARTREESSSFHLSSTVASRPLLYLFVLSVALALR